MAEGSNQRNKQDSPGIGCLWPEANLLRVGRTADPHNTWLHLNMQITNHVFNRAKSCFANSFLTTAAIFPVGHVINVQRLGFHTSLGQRNSWLLIQVASVALILVCLRASAGPSRFTRASENSLMFWRAASLVFCRLVCWGSFTKGQISATGGEMEGLRAPRRGEENDGSGRASS